MESINNNKRGRDEEAIIAAIGGNSSSSSEDDKRRKTDDMPTSDAVLAKWTQLDFSNYVAPKIITHQASANASPQAFPFDVKRVVYDKDLSAPNGRGTRQLFAKFQLPDSHELVDLFIETPVMTTPWGIGCSTWGDSAKSDKSEKNTSYSLQLNFRDPNDNFFKAMFQWDQHILNTIFASKQKWLPGTTIKSVDALEALFTGVCAPRKRLRDGQLFAPNLMLYLPKRNGELDVQCVDKNGNKFDVLHITAQMEMRVVFRHRIDFKAKSIGIRNEPVLIQIMESVRPTAFANPMM